MINSFLSRHASHGKAALLEITEFVLARLARPLVNQLELALGARLVHNEVVAQKLLVQHYRACIGTSYLPTWADVGFRKVLSVRGGRNASLYFRLGSSA